MLQQTMNNLTSTNSPTSSNETNIGTFLAFTTIYVCIGLGAIVGNGLVLHAAWSTKNLGILRYFDSSIKSLAVADMLFGLIAVPLRITHIGIHCNIKNITNITIHNCKYIKPNIFKLLEVLRVITL